MKKVLYILPMLLMINIMMSATSFSSLWKSVREAEDKDQPKTALGYIIPTGDKQTANGRPGNLYSFDEDKYNEEISKRSAI